MSILRRIFGGRIGKEKPTKQNIDTNRKDIYNILDIAPTVLSEKKELKLENCKFFIIEDNESTTNVLSFHLREAGIKAENISCAIDLPNAKEIYGEGGYDVLIVDYEIIGGTGADMILRLVKEIHPTGENRPIIIGNSANKDKDLSNHALRFFRENPFTQWHMDKDLDQYEDLEGIINKSAKKMNIYIVD